MTTSPLLQEKLPIICPLLQLKVIKPKFELMEEKTFNSLKNRKLLNETARQKKQKDRLETKGPQVQILSFRPSQTRLNSGFFSISMHA